MSAAARPVAPRTTPVHAVLGGLALLITVHLLLLFVAVEGFLAREDGILWPAAAVSGACCVAAFWLRTLLSPERAIPPLPPDGLAPVGDESSPDLEHQADQTAPGRA